MNYEDSDYKEREYFQNLKAGFIDDCSRCSDDLEVALDCKDVKLALLAFFNYPSDENKKIYLASMRSAINEWAEQEAIAVYDYNDELDFDRNERNDFYGDAA